MSSQANREAKPGASQMETVEEAPVLGGWGQAEGAASAVFCIPWLNLQPNGPLELPPLAPNKAAVSTGTTG